MFGKKVQVSLDLSEPMLREIRGLLKERDLDLNQAVNLFLYSSIREADLSFNKDLAQDFYTNIEERAKDFLFDELEKGRQSFDGPEIDQDQILIFLGLY